MRAPRHCAKLHCEHGATLVEAVVILPVLLFTVLALMQAALVFHAKSNLNYATHEAARAGSVHNANLSSIRQAFQRAMLPYYGGGRDQAELSAAAEKVAQDLGNGGALRVQILSPSQESFLDYNSPALQEALGTDEPVIPNVGVDELLCPRDVPSCASDPLTNASGQSLTDANLLKLRITYGIPPQKQMPMVGRFYTWALGKMGSAQGDPFMQSLLDARRIPVVTHTVLRMQSDPVRNAAMLAMPGPGNHGLPADPGPATAGDLPLPECPWWDPACSSCPDGRRGGNCRPEICTVPG
ncbi:MAG TPA: TadE family protein [Albitalea sp.]|uniref:TadE family protein n=1 Tax=Piscinibacter sp. TaxID=1903157 RepID=UPI002ED0F2D6